MVVLRRVMNEMGRDTAHLEPLLITNIAKLAQCIVQSPTVSIVCGLCGIQAIVSGENLPCFQDAWSRVNEGPRHVYATSADEEGYCGES